MNVYASQVTNLIWCNLLLRVCIARVLMWAWAEVMPHHAFPFVVCTFFTCYASFSNTVLTYAHAMRESWAPSALLLDCANLMELWCWCKSSISKNTIKKPMTKPSLEEPDPWQLSCCVRLGRTSHPSAGNQSFIGSTVHHSWHCSPDSRLFFIRLWLNHNPPPTTNSNLNTCMYDKKTSPDFVSVQINH